MQTQLTRTSVRACNPKVSAQCSRLVRSPALRVSPVVARAATEDKVDVASGNGATRGADTPANMLDFDELSDIIRMVHDTDIVELELKSKRFSLSVKKKDALKAAEHVIAHPMMTAAAMQPMMAAPMAAPAPAPAAPAPAAAAPAPAPAAAPAAPAAAAAPAVAGGVEVSSPMSGTMYRAPAPGEPPFVKEGDRVTKGQTVCIIEAMKLMNEIEAEVSGEVVKILVENGGTVAPGQPIMLIKP